MKLSFGMIFSIILIIIFMTFSFFAIKKFMGISNTAQIAKFKSALQADVDKVWKSSQSSQQMSYILPSKITHVCFVDFTIRTRGLNQAFYDDLNTVYFGSENLVFYPIGSAEGFDSTKIKNIDLNKMIENNNPFCFKNTDGKVKITLQKSYGESLVTLI